MPAYSLAIAPGAEVATLADLRGTRIGFSDGQEQGLFVLHALRQANLTPDDVDLVRLTSDKFQDALASDEIDVAPLSEPVLTRYLELYGADGASALHPDIEATPTTLTAPVTVLEDPEKVEALKSYVLAWQRAVVWQHENQEEWIQAYYVDNQGVTAEDGRRIRDRLGAPLFPRDFDRAKEIEQDAVDLLVEHGVIDAVAVEDLFDERFEGLLDPSVSDYVEP